MSEPTKRCPKCEQIKPLSGFPSSRGRPDGRGVYCRPCGIAQSIAWYRAHPEREGLRQKAYYQRNREKIAVYQRAYYQRRKLAAVESAG